MSKSRCVYYQTIKLSRNRLDLFYDFRFRVRLKKIDGKIFCLVQGGSGNNYFHFLFDIITKLKIYQQKFSLNEIDYFYVPGISDWQKKILSLFEISEDRLIDSNNFRHIKSFDFT